MRDRQPLKDEMILFIIIGLIIYYLLRWIVEDRVWFIHKLNGHNIVNEMQDYEQAKANAYDVILEASKDAAKEVILNKFISKKHEVYIMDCIAEGLEHYAPGDRYLYEWKMEVKYE